MLAILVFAVVYLITHSLAAAATWLAYTICLELAIALLVAILSAVH